MDKTKTKEKFIQEAIEIHGDKYGYEEVIYINGTTKVKIFCKKCNDYFYQTPTNHITRRGCPICADTTKTKEEFIKEAKEIHKEKYDYSEVIYINNYTKVKIFCKNCKEYFWQTPQGHVKNESGCSNCYGNKKLEQEEFIKNAIKIHGDKYNYDEVVYINNHTKVKIYCKQCNDYFRQTPTGHIIQKQGCPICCRGSKISKPSAEWLNYMNIEKENREIDFYFSSGGFCVFDGYQDNVAYEFDGDFWHGNPNKYNLNDIHPIRKVTYEQLYKETLKKHAAIREAGVILITIWESEWKEIKKSLKLNRQKSSSE